MVFSSLIPPSFAPTVAGHRSGLSIRPIQEFELERLRREVKEKNDLIRQLILTWTLRGEASCAAARSPGRCDLCGGHGRRPSARVLSSGRS